MDTKQVNTVALVDKSVEVLEHFRAVLFDLKVQKDMKDAEVAKILSKDPVVSQWTPIGGWTPKTVSMLSRICGVYRRPGPRGS